MSLSFNQSGRPFTGGDYDAPPPRTGLETRQKFYEFLLSLGVPEDALKHQDVYEMACDIERTVEMYRGRTT